MGGTTELKPEEEAYMCEIVQLIADNFQVFCIKTSLFQPFFFKTSKLSEMWSYWREFEFILKNIRAVRSPVRQSGFRTPTFF